MDILGLTAQDKITKFKGVITGFCTYISGCNQALVQPGVKEFGEHVDAHWIDIQRLEIDYAGPRVVLDSDQTPGPDKPAPKR